MARGGGCYPGIAALLHWAERTLVLPDPFRTCPCPPAGDITPEVVASAAVTSAEASGALPPLAGAQRAAVEGFFARLAAEMGQDSGSSSAAFEAFGGLALSVHSGTLTPLHCHSPAQRAAGFSCMRQAAFSLFSAVCRCALHRCASPASARAACTASCLPACRTVCPQAAVVGSMATRTRC
jgi:hypothetical protein